MEKEELVRRLKDARVLLVIDGAGDDALDSIRAAVDAGVWAIEAPLREGMEIFSAVAREQPGCILGAGGVTAAQEAWEAVEAGAKFVSAMPLDSEIAAVCEAAAVPTMAVVDGLPALEEALRLRPDFVRHWSDLGLLAARGEDGPGFVLDLQDDDPSTVEAAVVAGADVVAIAEGQLGAPSVEELKGKLAALVRSVQAAR